jgi:uncharacterized repeat protein (TIGR03803 family)
MQHGRWFSNALANFAFLFIFAGTPLLAATSYTTIFNLQPQSQEPFAPLVADSAGNLYGVTGVPGGGTIFELSPPAQENGSWTETTLFTFNGTSDGNEPESGLVMDSNGNLYGTTFGGGSGSCTLGGASIGCGVVFELSQSGGSWNETVLYNFQGGKDGRNPQYSPMTFDTTGNLYGTTTFGGGKACSLHIGCGVLFKLAPPKDGGTSWTESVMHRFVKKQGTSPQGSLLYLAGSLYGMTASGGANNFGTAYESTLKGKVTVINNFDGASGGSDNFPGGLAADASGDLYGFTSAGGAANYGVAFGLAPSGGNWTETVLYTFTGTSDGGNPVGAPALDKSGNLYGNTQAGGNYADCAFTAQQNGCGVVFKIAPSGGKGSESVLHTFTDGTTPSADDGAFPAGGLVFGKDGDLFGTTQIGGTGACYSGKGSDLGCGTVFSVAP